MGLMGWVNTRPLICLSPYGMASGGQEGPIGSRQSKFFTLKIDEQKAIPKFLLDFIPYTRDLPGNAPVLGGEGTYQKKLNVKTFPLSSSIRGHQIFSGRNYHLSKPLSRLYQFKDFHISLDRNMNFV